MGKMLLKCSSGAQSMRLSVYLLHTSSKLLPCFFWMLFPSFFFFFSLFLYWLMNVRLYYSDGNKIHSEKATAEDPWSLERRKNSQPTSTALHRFAMFSLVTMFYQWRARNLTVRDSCLFRSRRGTYWKMFLKTNEQTLLQKWFVYYVLVKPLHTRIHVWWCSSRAVFAGFWGLFGSQRHE